MSGLLIRNHARDSWLLLLAGLMTVLCLVSLLLLSFSRMEAGHPLFGAAVPDSPLQQPLQQLLGEWLDQGQARLVRQGPLLVIELDKSVLFQDDTMQLRTDSQPLLQQLAQLLAEAPCSLRLAGYSNRNVDNPWQDAGLRAAAVARFLLQQTTMKPERLQVQAMSVLFLESSRAGRVDVMVMSDADPTNPG
ncbi:MAG: hypothetical protein HQL58_09475 [Magnetococcales bacterium]|nr:hypothetical protein [Magnetococcales bacterium]